MAQLYKRIIKQPVYKGVAESSDAVYVKVEKVTPSKADTMLKIYKNHKNIHLLAFYVPNHFIKAFS